MMTQRVLKGVVIYTLIGLVAVAMLTMNGLAGYATFQDAMNARIAEGQPLGEAINASLHQDIIGGERYDSITVTPFDRDCFKVVVIRSLNVPIMSDQVLRMLYVMNDQARQVSNDTSVLMDVYLLSEDGSLIAIGRTITDQPYSPVVRSFGGVYAVGSEGGTIESGEYKTKNE